MTGKNRPYWLAAAGSNRSAKSAPTNSAFTREAPPADPNVASELNQQLTDAAQAEKEVLMQAQQEIVPVSPSPTASLSSTPEPVTIHLGQSVDQMTGTLGSPLTVIDLGSKKISKYRDMKITFMNGKVSDVQ